MMWRFVDKLWWMLFGIFCAADFAVGTEALHEEGGSMPLAVLFFWPFTVGGLVIFGLSYWLIQRKINQHIAARKWWVDAEAYDEKH